MPADLSRSRLGELPDPVIGEALPLRDAVRALADRGDVAGRVVAVLTVAREIATDQRLVSGVLPVDLLRGQRAACLVVGRLRPDPVRMRAHRRAEHLPYGEYAVSLPYQSWPDTVSGRPSLV